MGLTGWKLNCWDIVCIKWSDYCCDDILLTQRGVLNEMVESVTSFDMEILNVNSSMIFLGLKSLTQRPRLADDTYTRWERKGTTD